MVVEPSVRQFPRHLMSIDDLGDDHIEMILAKSKWMEKQKNSRLSALYSSSIFGSFFFQNSTRTRLSFEAAAARLGFEVIGFPDPGGTRSSDFFQESIRDTLLTVSQYVDCMVVRSPINFGDDGFINSLPSPIINGGNSDIEHPTQALVDYWLLLDLIGPTMKGKTIGLLGDPNCRDFKSLIKLLRRSEIDYVLFLPPNNFETDSMSTLFKGTSYAQVNCVDTLLTNCDAIYVLPFLLPSFNESYSPAVTNESTLDERFILTAEKLSSKGRCCPPILHVGPRGGELPINLDKPPVYYIEQVRRSVFLRAALIDLIMNC